MQPIRGSFGRPQPRAPALFWPLAVTCAPAAATALLGAPLLRWLAAHIHTHPDARIGINSAAGLALPIPYARNVDNGWLVYVSILLLIGLVCALSMMAAGAIGARRGSFVHIALLQAAVFGALALWPLTLSGDVYAYALWGRLYGVYGADPYQAFVLSGKDTLIASIVGLYGNPPPVDDYGPAFTLLAGAVGRLERAAPLVMQLLSYRLLAIACALAAAAGLWKLLTRNANRSNALQVAVFSFNPLVMYECAVEGHVDMMMIAPAIWSYALAAETPLIAGVLLGAAIAVKFVAIVFAPFVMLRSARDAGWPAALAGGLICAVVVVLAFVPFWKGPSTLMSLWLQAHVIGGSPMWLAHAAWSAVSSAGSDRFLIGLALIVLAAVLSFAVWAYSRDHLLKNIWRAVAAVIWTAPAINPQYLLWLSPAMVSGGRWASYAWSLAVSGLAVYALTINRLADSDAERSAELALLAVALIVVPLVYSRLASWPAASAHAEDGQ